MKELCRAQRHLMILCKGTNLATELQQLAAAKPKYIRCPSVIKSVTAYAVEAVTPLGFLHGYTAARAQPYPAELPQHVQIFDTSSGGLHQLLRGFTKHLGPCAV